MMRIDIFSEFSFIEYMKYFEGVTNLRQGSPANCPHRDSFEVVDLPPEGHIILEGHHIEDHLQS